MTRRRHRQMPTAERLASLVGGVIVLGTIVFLAVETLRRGDQEPSLTVSVVQVRGTAAGFVVDVEVRNQTRGAAADVQLAGSDRASNGRQWHALARLDYVPGFSKRRATLVFESDPGSAPRVRIIGYARP